MNLWSTPDPILELVLLKRGALRGGDPGISLLARMVIVENAFDVVGHARVSMKVLVDVSIRIKKIVPRPNGLVSRHFMHPTKIPLHISNGKAYVWTVQGDYF